MGPLHWVDHEWCIMNLDFAFYLGVYQIVNNVNDIKEDA